MATKTLIASDLEQFTGTETWFRHSLARNILYTEGVQYMAEQAGAYWLIDMIALNQSKVKDHPFQVWKLVLTENGGADLTCEDGNGNVVLSTVIDWTDFPLPEISLWFTDNVILLPSEY